MLKYPCLVLDHDDTVVQSEATIAYPCFVQTLARIRPGVKLTLEEYYLNCSKMVFADMCRTLYGFTDEELYEEYLDWKAFVREHIPDPFPGIGRILERQKAEGGLICVVSHSAQENIHRDYLHHFGFLPDRVYGCDLPEEQRKPSTFALYDIMKRYGFTPEQLLVVDDLALAREMAHAAGVKMAYAAWGKAAFPELVAEMGKDCDFTFDSTEKLEKFLFDSLDNRGIMCCETR